MAATIGLCAGCGRLFVGRPQKKWCSERCRKATARSGQPTWAENLEGAEETICPSCGVWCTTLDEFTGWCNSCTRELALVGGAR